MKFVLALLVTLSIFANVLSWRYFHNGRVHGGNLGEPRSPRRFLEDENGKNYTRWFTQNLDHFDVGNPNKWQQRYYVNDEYVNDKRNVAFLMIGGEGVASEVWMTQGAWIDYAKKFNAIMFQLEHRFYGESRPTEDLSLENLKYLTSEQALADLANFVSSANTDYNLDEEVRWIAFGGSYPGSLAAWARLKYPHLIHASVSTSGPLLAVPDFSEYFGVVADDLRNVDEDCYTAVKKGTSEIELLTKHTLGLRKLTSLFKLCDPLEESNRDENDMANFYTNLAGNFAGIAQYNKDNRLSTRGTLLGNITLDTACAIMTNKSVSTEVERLANYNSLMLEATKQTCMDIKYSNMIESMKNTSWDSETAEGGRQWSFQTCNEFGFYQTSNKKPQIFGDKFGLNFSIQQCIDVFGDVFNATYLDYATSRTNMIYGALDIEVDNVLFVHGSVDPWHALGITTSINPGTSAIFIKGTAHCAEVYPPSDDDLPQLKAARVQIQNQIQSWLDI